MSHQGSEGWFPECIVCGCGNVGPVVCLQPACHEKNGLVPIELEKTFYIAGDLSVDEKLIEEDKHFWKCCQICDNRLISDPASFGSYAICIDCFNIYTTAKVWPPTRPRELYKHLAKGILSHSKTGKPKVKNV